METLLFNISAQTVLNTLMNLNLMRSLVQVYCKTCQRCICAICVLEEHRMHKTVSVQTERVSKQVEVTEI